MSLRRDKWPDLNKVCHLGTIGALLLKIKDFKGFVPLIFSLSGKNVLFKVAVADKTETLGVFSCETDTKHLFYNTFIF